MRNHPSLICQSRNQQDQVSPSTISAQALLDLWTQRGQTSRHRGTVSRTMLSVNDLITTSQGGGMMTHQELFHGNVSHPIFSFGIALPIQPISPDWQTQILILHILQYPVGCSPFGTFLHATNRQWIRDILARTSWPQAEGRITQPGTCVRRGGCGICGK